MDLFDDSDRDSSASDDPLEPHQKEICGTQKREVKKDTFVHWEDADQRRPHHWVSLVQKERDAGQGSQPVKGGKQKWPQNCLTHNSGMNELPTGVSSLTVGSPIMIMVQQCEMSLFVC